MHTNVKSLCCTAETNSSIVCQLYFNKKNAKISKNHQWHLWIHIAAYVDFPRALSLDPDKIPHELGGHISVCFFKHLFVLCSTLFQKGIKGPAFGMANKMPLKQMIRIRKKTFFWQGWLTCTDFGSKKHCEVLNNMIVAVFSRGR